MPGCDITDCLGSRSGISRASKATPAGVWLGGVWGGGFLFIKLANKTWGIRACLRSYRVHRMGSSSSEAPSNGITTNCSRKGGNFKSMALRQQGCSVGHRAQFGSVALRPALGGMEEDDDKREKISKNKEGGKNKAGQK